MSRLNISSVFSGQSRRQSEMGLIQPSSSMTKSFFPQRKTLFSHDQEIFVDSPTPLILISDHNAMTPHPPLSGRPGMMRGSRLRQIEAVSQSQTNLPSKRFDMAEVTEGDRSEIAKTPLTEHRKRGSEENPLNLKEGEVPEDLDIFNVATEEKKEVNPIKAKINKFLDSRNVNIALALFVFYALFASDFRTLLFGASADLGFDVMTFITFGVFVVEIILALISKEGYIWSFFFWLDAISTISVLIDITIISSDIFPSGTADVAQIARASRASRIGSRAGRVVRIVRLFRLAKLYKQAKATQIKITKHKKVTPVVAAQTPTEHEKLIEPFNLLRGNTIGSEELSPTNKIIKPGYLKSQLSLTRQASLFRPPSMEIQSKINLEREPSTPTAPEEEEDHLKESRVGKKLSDLTTKRVIVIVLALLLFIPMFSSDFFNDTPASGSYEVPLLVEILNSDDATSSAKNAAINEFISQEMDQTPSLIVLIINGEYKYIDTSIDLSEMRETDLQTLVFTTETYGDLICTFNSKPENTFEAGLNVGRTFFMILVLTFGSLFFSKDANILVLRPIERMIEKVNRIAKDPLIAKDETLVRDVNAGLENETVQIENAIIKIGGLLALGYGDAGSAIVAQNMAQSGDLNPMLPGKRVGAIFGFCDIRNFTDATEVLQEGVMVFVNSIADIVHSTIDKFGGAANKNIGDAFLLVWKLPSDLEGEENLYESRHSRVLNNTADFAVISFLKINAGINRDPTILAYREDPGLNGRIPNYKVKMGFGLHIGWSIEGAIGSEFKIDASYLSPNVNMASRLEAATKQYGVPLLFSGDLYYCLSPKMQEKARLIDIVTVKGSLQPIELYTCDIDVEDFIQSKSRTRVPKEVKKENQKLEKKILEEILLHGQSSVIIETDKELQHLFRNNDPEFNELFRAGIEAYVEGDWSLAKKKFEECLKERPSDGPTKNLMHFLKDNDFIAPEDWEGYHVLTEK